MIKSGMVVKAEEKIKLVRGNKVIERNLMDYQNNKNHYEMRGFKPYTEKKSVVKETKENVVSITKKVKKNVKKTKKKN